MKPKLGCSRETAGNHEMFENFERFVCDEAFRVLVSIPQTACSFLKVDYTLRRFKMSFQIFLGKTILQSISPL